MTITHPMKVQTTGAVKPLCPQTATHLQLAPQRSPPYDDQLRQKATESLKNAPTARP
jgi:hypothetical protein